MSLESQWPQIRRAFGEAFASSMHFSVATVSPNGRPHVTPIGSVLLQEPGRGIYFEEFPRRMPSHFNGNARVCVLAVNSSRWFWLGALLRGRFPRPPAVRLYGEVGSRRRATAQERRWWLRRVRRVRFTRGHRLLWSSMGMVRELHFTEVDIVNLRTMTADLRDQWSSQTASPSKS